MLCSPYSSCCALCCCCLPCPQRIQASKRGTKPQLQQAAPVCVHTRRMQQELHEELAPQGARAHTHWRAALLMHVGWLRLEVRPLRRAHAARPQAHRRPPVRVRRVPPLLCPQRPSLGPRQGALALHDAERALAHATHEATTQPRAVLRRVRRVVVVTPHSPSFMDEFWRHVLMHVVCQCWLSFLLTELDILLLNLVLLRCFCLVWCLFVCEWGAAAWTAQQRSCNLFSKQLSCET